MIKIIQVIFVLLALFWFALALVGRGPDMELLLLKAIFYSVWVLILEMWEDKARG